MADSDAGDAAAPKRRRGPGRPFQPGQSGNPSGMPKGARAGVYAALDAAAAEHMPHILDALVTKAREGDPRAAELLMRRAWPERKGRVVEFDLPAIGTAADVDAALGGVLQATAAGELTPEEAALVASVLELRRRSIELVDVQARLAALEERTKR